MRRGLGCHRDECGMALVVAAAFLAVAAIVLGAAAMMVINQSRQVSAEQQFQDCFAGLETAVVASVHDLEQGGPGNVGIDDAPPPAGPGEPNWPSFDDDDVSPQATRSMPNVKYLAFVQDWSSDGLDNNGDTVSDGPEEENYYTLYAMAHEGGMLRKAEVTARTINVNIWNNALFGGPGRPDGVVAGDAEIHGSVHLLGTNILEGNSALGGPGTHVRNTYDGLDSDMRVRLPALQERVWRGEPSRTLGAAVRIRNGLTVMSGDASLGEPDEPGNGVKETLDGTYVTDGWVGSGVEDDGVRGAPSQVYSDNGSTVAYNLGERVRFPLLSDPAQAAGANGSTHVQYFDESLSGEPYPGSLTIRTGEDFYFNASRPDDLDPKNRQTGDDYLYFDGVTNVLEMNGQVEINGDLTFAVGTGTGGGGGGEGEGDGEDEEEGPPLALAGSVNLNPNNSTSYEFLLVKPDGTTITRDTLHNSTGSFSYTGPAKYIRFKPKGNGNQNSLTIDGVTQSLRNGTLYTLWADDLTVRVYNDKPKKSNGHWWMEVLGGAGAAVVEGAQEPPVPVAEEEAGEEMILSGRDMNTVRYKGSAALLVHGDVTVGTGLVSGDAEIVPAEDIEFEIEDGKVTPKEEYTASVKVLGAAITYSGAYDMPVTARLNVGGTWSEPWGSYSNATAGNLNDGRQHPHELGSTFAADTSIGIQAQSWYKQGNQWRSSLSANSWANSPQVKVLRNGDSVPDIEPFLNQAAIETYVQAYIDPATHKVVLQQNQAIFLFELGTTSLHSDAADFQDLVVLMSLQPPTDEGSGQPQRGTIAYQPLPFPGNILGIMAEDELRINGGGTADSQRAMGALYAQNRTSIAGDLLVVGSLVANSFDLSNPAPRLYQVPALVRHLPQGMIGANPIVAAERLAWREVGAG